MKSLTRRKFYNFAQVSITAFEKFLEVEPMETLASIATVAKQHIFLRNQLI